MTSQSLYEAMFEAEKAKMKRLRKEVEKYMNEEFLPQEFPDKDLKFEWKEVS